LNAVQAMPDGGRLFVSSSIRRATRRGAAAAFLEVRFRDTGVGIPPGDLRNLFIPFFTTKDKGTGLGLPISQRIIENHGGTIEVRSQSGAGATFTVLLPVESDAYAAYVDKKVTVPVPTLPRPVLSLPGPVTPPPVPVGFPGRTIPGVSPPPAAVPIPSSGVSAAPAGSADLTPAVGRMAPPSVVVVSGAKTPPLGTIIAHKRS
ncbi:MAG: hypothetical protein H7X95_01175, partial [Deltaproteobacteria bacterium]|nr:hypothetical protein [Deltaproteobacteria bacterium]